MVERTTDRQSFNVPVPVGTPTLQEEPPTRKKFNILSVFVLFGALTAIGIGLFTTSTIAVLIALVITFVLAGISIRRIRSREMSGKGFAIVGLVLAAITAVATAIVIGVTGGL